MVNSLFYERMSVRVADKGQASCRSGALIPAPTLIMVIFLPFTMRPLFLTRRKQFWMRAAC
jgi:hypothetical protein